MAEGPGNELQQTKTANSPTAAELTDPGGSTREGNGYMPMASIVNNGYTPMASILDTAYTPMSPIVDNGYTPMASLQKASDVPPPLPPKMNRRRQGGPSRPSGQTSEEPPVAPGQTPEDPFRRSGQTPGDPSRPAGQTPGDPSHPPGQTPAARLLLPKRRNAKRAGVYWLREEDIVNLPLNPMYGADLDLPPGPDGSDHGQQTTPKEVGGPSQAGGPDDGRRQGDQAASGPATHTYEDGDAFGMRLGPPLKGDPRSAPPVPSTPRPGRTTDGAQPVAAATHVYENGESFGMRLGPALKRDAPAVPSTPRPGRPTGGAQQVPGGPNPLSNQQDVINQLQPNPMYNSNQAPQALGPAEENRTICGRLRRRLSRRPLMYTVMSLSLAFGTAVTLAIVVPVLLTHFNRQPGIHGSPTTITAGPNTAGSTATAGLKTTDSGAWQGSALLMGTGKVTSADVIKVSPVHGRGPSPGITAEMEAAGPAPITMPGSTGTGETSDQASRPRIITFGDEPGAGKLRGGRGVAVSPDNKIWVADRSTTRLKVYNMEGVYQYHGQFSPGLGYSSKKPSDVSIDKDGHLWVLMLGYPASPDSVVQVTRHQAWSPQSQL
ncbi:nascent polypeptide-associated complex subunit alpha, muscle-specific form-like [Branchiostoma floridae]|uniref:Nascent polypeptide-associated complex subunit alpha, muscle-specific form-like n=1 Tax=Branchiostoma floridae TaxID=7739 RepID=A0A9J7LA19_BRAFL|nr:nascent polypeptide-associated complex subunit alpha, muscle-specific form-like [Branchiostoma floridae]